MGRGLEDDAVAGRQRRCQLPGRGGEREVERDDGGHHAHRLVAHHVVARDRDELVGDPLVGARSEELGVVLEDLGGGRDVGGAALAEGPAAVAHLGEHQRFLALLDGEGDGVERVGAFTGGSSPPDPVPERPGGGLDRAFEVGLARGGDRRPGGPVGRVDALGGPTGGGRGARSVDEEAVLHGQPCGKIDFIFWAIGMEPETFSLPVMKAMGPGSLPLTIFT